MKIRIKYMVCIRCKMIVRAELNKMGFHCIKVELGEVEIMETMSDDQKASLQLALVGYGLEMMNDKKTVLIEKIKSTVIEMVHYADELPKGNFSDHLSDKLQHNYTYLANLFSETEGTTINHFMILHKIEKVKELIMYDELNLSEIASKLHYSSVAALSNQFKKITGLTPSYFKSLKHKKRKSIENL